MLLPQFFCSKEEVSVESGSVLVKKVVDSFSNPSSFKAEVRISSISPLDRDPGKLCKIRPAWNPDMFSSSLYGLCFLRFSLEMVLIAETVKIVFLNNVWSSHFLRTLF